MSAATPAADTTVAAAGAPEFCPPHRRPKPCPHNAQHRHGTYTAYRHDGCRCFPCLSAQRMYRRRADRDRAYGRPRLVDAAPARDHVNALRAAGLGIKKIGEITGLGSTLHMLMWAHGDFPPSRRIKPETASAIMAVPIPGVAELAPGRRIPSLGARRRVQALMRLGWTARQIADTAGIPRFRVANVLTRDATTVHTHRAIAAAYNRLWDRPPRPGDRFAKAAATRIRKTAEACGWPPPAAWDDDEIDQPAGRPAGYRGSGGTRTA